MKYTCQVIKGKGRGKKIVGFPTFNLVAPAEFKVKQGVYACRVWIGNKEYRGAMHYGSTPTFDDLATVLEIFVLDYRDAAPATELTFELGPYLRPVATFLSPKALRHQIALDVARVRHASFK